MLNRCTGHFGCHQMVLEQNSRWCGGLGRLRAVQSGRTRYAPCPATPSTADSILTFDLADSNMARDSFKTFIPLSVENGARSSIIFNFFDLLSAIAAHGKTNGFGGRKLSRMAAWWAFEHKETGTGFDGGYKEWLK